MMKTQRQMTLPVAVPQLLVNDADEELLQMIFWRRFQTNTLCACHFEYAPEIARTLRTVKTVTKSKHHATQELDGAIGR